MYPILWAGNSSNPRTLNGVPFQPDLVWVKDRTQAANHRLVDVVRGAEKTIKSNTTDSETTSEIAGTVTAFTSDGFTVQGTSTVEGVNLSGDNYVAWNWKAGGAAVTNTAGTISSQVSANTTSGFSIVTYTGTGLGSSATVGHGLGVAPSMIIIKARSTTEDWYVYHSSLGLNKYLRLNLTDAVGTATNLFNTVNSTVFNPSYTGTSGITNVAYCWSEVAGYSKFGSYTGNGSADGPFVYLGFRPRWVMIKHTNQAGNNWRLVDTARLGYNPNNYALFPSLADAEAAAVVCDMLSNGIKFRSTAQGVNGSGDTYIYAAFAENPFKYANAR
jgi:hypothetical protein